MLPVDEELAFAGPGRLAELVRARQVQPRELVELFLGRIQKLDPKLNAFRVTLADEALEAAETAAGADGALAGVPIAIKDEMPVAGQPVTFGSRTYGPPAPADAECVKRLRDAGAIPIGVTNVPEFTIWPWTASDANGITRNPWNPDRTTGGSSGGSGAAVAAGMAACATGSDGGGSIRIPAACCGLVGMKPTRDLVPLAPANEHWLGLTAYGGLARTVPDSALMLEVMAGRSGYREAADKADPGRLRIAISRKIPRGLIASVAREQRAAWEDVAGVLGELGHDVSERHPNYGNASLEFVQTWARGIYEDSLTVPEPDKLERSTRGMARAGRVLVSDARAVKLRERRARTAARILALWDDVDVLLTPGLASTPIKAEAGHGKSALAAFNIAGRFTPWTAIFNLTGQPAVTIPAGMSSDGVPLSVQLVGRLGAEETLYGLAAQIESARPWADRRPELALV